MKIKSSWLTPAKEILQPKPFTAIMAVHGAPEATELSLRTTLATCANFLESIEVYDSSQDNVTSSILSQFPIQTNLVNIHSVGGGESWKHFWKIEEGIQNAKTPYVVILDSDIEFTNGTVFNRALSIYRNDEKAFILGEFLPVMVIQKGYIRAEQFAAGAIFIRTEIAKQYMANGIGFKPIQKRDFRAAPGERARRIRVMYDVGGLLTEKSQLDDFHNINIDMQGLVHFGGMSVKINNTNEDIQEEYKSALEIIKDRLANRVWNKLRQESVYEK